MRPPFRIAVIECDTPLPDVVKQFGTYGDIFEGLLKAGVDALGQPDVISSKDGLQVTKWNVVDNEDGYPALADVDAILLTGSSECWCNLKALFLVLIVRRMQNTIRLTTSPGS